jgi:hypothetical protein
LNFKKRLGSIVPFIKYEAQQKEFLEKISWLLIIKKSFSNVVCREHMVEMICNAFMFKIVVTIYKTIFTRNLACIGGKM